MTKGIYKRRSPIQEKLARIKDVVLKDASYESLLKYYNNSGIKKKRKYIEYKSGYTRGNYKSQKKSQIEDIRNYIKENNITKEEVISALCIKD